MKSFTEFPDLAAERLGGAVLIANDEFFAPKESLLHAGPAVWKEGEYTDRGKWMDGWETRRRREPGNDWAIVALAHPGVIRKIEVDTAFFKGNYPDRCSLQAAYVTGGTDESLVTQAMFWPVLLPEQPLQMDRQHFYEREIAALGAVTHVRFNIFPDGGVSRLRLWGELA